MDVPASPELPKYKVCLIFGLHFDVEETQRDVEAKAN